MDDEYGDIGDDELIFAESHVLDKEVPVSVRPLITTSTTSQQSTLPFSGSIGPALAVVARQVNEHTPEDLDTIHIDEFNASRVSEGLSINQRQPLKPATRPQQRTPGQLPQSLKQTTLWGQTVPVAAIEHRQAPTGRPFRADVPPEAPTHHSLNANALSTWVYPTNLGPVRDYQFSIAKNGLFHNTLVALPTGLGKTFIAATVILNFFRWTRNAKIVFVAPTKPLVAQQVDACLNIAGIPRSQATRLDGEVKSVVRQGEWESKRLFFMTPQTLMNDLSRGIADPKSIVLLVVDEAHRATGEYAYVKVVEFMRRFSGSFRILALTATPGSKVEAVQDIIDNLGISHVEIRTEDSIDIRQYVHSRSIDTVLLDPSDEIIRVGELFSKVLKPLVDQLGAQNTYWGRDPMSLTTYGLVKARQEWMNGPARHLNQGAKWMINTIFSILQSLAHSIKMLSFHGIRPFYDNIKDFRDEQESRGEKGSKYKRQILANPSFQEMMTMIEKWMRLDGFVGHPKMTYLCDTLLNHFMDAGKESNTRAIVFSEYRDSAEEIVRVLNTHRPLLKATVFVGQADSKRSEGMKQKQQVETIDQFKAGSFNVLVATSIGEEGLDIGQVDLIVCYDASSSPIRMLQRMGRTGRKRNGNIVLLLMKGKEEDKFAEAKDNYEKMQKLISDGSRFLFRHDLSSRIVPRDIRPEVNMCVVDIPLENTQSKDLLDPKKAAAALRRKPAKKKFHMPNNVETGFVKASFFESGSRASTKSKFLEHTETEFLATKPHLVDVLLSRSQTEHLNRLYRNLPFHQVNMQEITGPNLGAFPIAQRDLQATVQVKHGEYTTRCVKLFQKLGRFSGKNAPSMDLAEDEWQKLPVATFASDTEGEASAKGGSALRKRRRISTASENDVSDDKVSRKRKTNAVRNKPLKKKTKRVSAVLDDCEDNEEEDENDEDSDAAGDTHVDENGELAFHSSRHVSGRPQKQRSSKQRRTSIGRGRLKKGAGDILEEIGDDCDRTSDLDVSDDSDSGADLIDFIVGEDDITSSMMRSNDTTSPITASSDMDPPFCDEAGYNKPWTSGGATETAYFEPINFPQTQESEEDLPGVDQLGSRGGPQALSMPPRSKVTTSRKRRDIVIESDDE